MTSSVNSKRPGVQCVRSRSEVAAVVDHWRRTGHSIGLVPTMGALHDGHLSLIGQIKKHSDKVITSIFVNPTQFGPNEDLSRYPRSEAEDIEKLAERKCDLVYLPQVEEMYPSGSVTHVRVEEMSDRLEGQFRPHFFYGVTTVVARLFIHTRPDVAIFGQKDFQQLQIIRRMVCDLGFPIDIIGSPTVRDDHGLALSSRNAYLSDEQIECARAIYRSLNAIADGIKTGTQVDDLLNDALIHLQQHGFNPIDYIALVDSDTLDTFASTGTTRSGKPDQPDLQAVNSVKSNSMDGCEPVQSAWQSSDNQKEQKPTHGRLLVAAWLGDTRLIDNISCPVPSSSSMHREV